MVGKQVKNSKSVKLTGGYPEQTALLPMGEWDGEGDRWPTTAGNDLPGETTEVKNTEVKNKVIGPGIAPVDLVQAAIGIGMSIFTRYAKVLNADGQPMSVREALMLINATLDEILAERDGDFDAITRFAIAWFEQHAFGEGEFGVAETLSKARNINLNQLVKAGILKSKRGRVQLLHPEKLPDNWNPSAVSRLSDWEILHQLIRRLRTGGENKAAELVAKLGLRMEPVVELAWRLYMVCDRRQYRAEAVLYNTLVRNWSEIMQLVEQRKREEKLRAENESLLNMNL